MERWDVLNRSGEKTGETLTRGEQLQDGQFHLVVHVWFWDGQRLLIQKRSLRCEVMPGVWACTSGSVVSGESSRSAALREVKEELGISLAENDLHFIRRFRRKNSFVDLFLVHRSFDSSQCTLQDDEVDDIRWVSKDTLKHMILDSKFHNYGQGYFRYLFFCLKNNASV